MKLHELPQRRLESTVQLMEAALDRMERLVSEGGKEGIVAVVNNSLSREDRVFLLEKISQLRGSLKDFAERFELQTRSRDIRQILGGELSSAWVMLENCMPTRMKGYGVKFDDPVRMALEEQIEGLLTQVIALRDGLQ